MKYLPMAVVALGLSLACAFAQTIPIEMRRVWCAEGFVPARFESFCLEDLKEPNRLSQDVWVAVQQEIIRGMKAKGYRYEPQTGQLRVSYGAFPPNDVSHPEVGLYLKLRVGERLLDLTKWSVGAMTEAPYVQGTMVSLAGGLIAEVPPRLKP